MQLINEWQNLKRTHLGDGYDDIISSFISRVNLCFKEQCHRFESKKENQVIIFTRKNGSISIIRTLNIRQLRNRHVGTSLLLAIV